MSLEEQQFTQSSTTKSLQVNENSTKEIFSASYNDDVLYSFKNKDTFKHIEILWSQKNLRKI